MGPIVVDWIKWGDRAMTLRGSVYYLRDAVTATVAYAHVAHARLMSDDGTWHVVFAAGPETYDLQCLDEGVARDAAAELARRMGAGR